jgi:hypothetical protein
MMQCLYLKGWKKGLAGVLEEHKVAHLPDRASQEKCNFISEYHCTKLKSNFL